MPSYSSESREIFLYRENMCEGYCRRICVRARACICRDFPDDFSTDLSTAMAQMHVTPYVPLCRCRLFLLRVALTDRMVLSLHNFRILMKIHVAYSIHTIYKTTRAIDVRFFELLNQAENRIYYKTSNFIIIKTLFVIRDKILFIILCLVIQKIIWRLRIYISI